MSAQWMLIVAAAATFAAVIIVSLILVQRRETAARKRSLKIVAGYASPTGAVGSGVESDDAESATSRVMLSTGERLVREKARARLNQQLALAGGSAPGAIDALVIRKVLFLIIGAALGLMAWWIFSGAMWIAIPLLAVGGFFLPDLLVYNTGLKRSEEMGLKLPDALDMLNLCVESGLSFQAALAQVAMNQEGPVAQEFAIALQEMQYGRSRDEALAGIAARTKQEDTRRFIAAMLQVDKLGVPVATVLREQARAMRAKRFDRAREQAQKVPVKILMPLMLCFLPTLFIVLLASPVSQMVKMFANI
jgi:tight adherence protein C